MTNAQKVERFMLQVRTRPVLAPLQMLLPYLQFQEADDVVGMAEEIVDAWSAACQEG
jgi:hypothetical protein